MESGLLAGVRRQSDQRHAALAELHRCRGRAKIAQFA
jgi:hypothetical protein